MYSSAFIKRLGAKKNWTVHDIYVNKFKSTHLYAERSLCKEDTPVAVDYFAFLLYYREYHTHTQRLDGCISIHGWYPCECRPCDRMLFGSRIRILKIFTLKQNLEKKVLGFSYISCSPYGFEYSKPSELCDKRIKDGCNSFKCRYCCCVFFSRLQVICNSKARQTINRCALVWICDNVIV